MFQIIGKYNVSKYEGHGYYSSFEVIDTASNLEEANVMVQEYEMAFGNEFRVDFRRV